MTNDDRLGGELVVDHLVSLGHRQIAHIHGGSGAGAHPRRTGYERAMRRHGLSAEIRSVAGAYTEDAGMEGMEELLDSGDRPTAVFAANDVAAIGALDVLDEYGLRVPEDMSVVGYDNTHISGRHRFDLTTVDQPRFEIGRTAVSLLLERLDEGGSKPSEWSSPLVWWPGLVGTWLTARRGRARLSRSTRQYRRSHVSRQHPIRN